MLDAQLVLFALQHVSQAGYLISSSINFSINTFDEMHTQLEWHECYESPISKR